MNNDNFSIKPSSSEGVKRYDDDSKRPSSGAASAASSFKKILEKDEESPKSKVTDSEDENGSGGTYSGQKDATLVGKRGQKSGGEAEEEGLFSLFAPKKPVKESQPVAKGVVKTGSKGEKIFTEDELAANFEDPKAKISDESEYISVGEDESQNEKSAQQMITRGTPKTPQSSQLAEEEIPSQFASLSEVNQKGQEETARLQLANKGTISSEIKRSEVAIGQQGAIPIEPRKQSGENIFGLSAGRKTADKGTSESPSSIFSRASKKEGLGDNQDAISAYQNLSSDEETEEGTFVGGGVTRKDNVANPFPQEQVDISAVNPQGYVSSVTQAGFNPVNTVTEVVRPVQIPQAMHLLAEKLISELATKQLGDKTETFITLGNNSGIFSGAQVVITEFASARREFNVTIANLTQNAQQVIHQQQANLMTALEAKGYFVHIFTATTTEVQSPVIAASAEQGRERQQGQPEEQRQKSKQNQEGTT